MIFHFLSAKVVTNVAETIEDNSKIKKIRKGIIAPASTEIEASVEA